MTFGALDLAGHFGYAAMLAGLLLIGRGQRSSRLALFGWPLRLIGEATWVVIGVTLADRGIVFTSIILWGLIFMAADLFGWLEARRRLDP